MKKSTLILVLVVNGVISFSQIDTNYATQAVSAVWMPDGQSLLIGVVKYHKTKDNSFSSRVFKYDIASKQITALLDNANNLAPSPDGKTIAFFNIYDNKKHDIRAFELETKKELVLYTDTSRKNALEWSPDGKNLVYNVSSNGEGQKSTIDICVLNIATKKVKQVTNSGKHKAYDPGWSPDSKRIVYYLEKEDGHDQIWLTDINGSFHTNLTNDTSTHNYFASWFDEQTVLYTQSPGTIILMNVKDRKKRKVEGINAEQVKYNSVAGKFVYVNSETDNNVVLYDWKKKTSTIILDGKKMSHKF